jgi:hypothetical protein
MMALAYVELLWLGWKILIESAAIISKWFRLDKSSAEWRLTES